jgi:hypothetical protein
VRIFSNRKPGVIEKFEEILKIFSPKQQNLSLGTYNPIDWHKKEFVVSQIKVGITTRASWPCSPVL